jgi:hypothetical protein
VSDSGYPAFEYDTTKPGAAPGGSEYVLGIVGVPSRVADLAVREPAEASHGCEEGEVKGVEQLGMLVFVLNLEMGIWAGMNDQLVTFFFDKCVRQ